MRVRVCLALVATAGLATGTARGQVPDAPVLTVAVVVRADSPPLLDRNGNPARGLDQTLSDIDFGLRDLARIRAPLAVSASPVWVDELVAADRTREYAALLAIATRRPLLAAPYAHVLLTGEPRRARSELDRGEIALRHALQAASQRILDPPSFALSDDVLSAARSAGLKAALASADVVGPEPVDVRGVTVIPSIELPAGHPTDYLLERFGPNARIALVAPSGRRLSAALRSLSTDKRVRLVNIGDLLIRPGHGTIEWDPPPDPPSAYGKAAGDARAALSAFVSYTLADNPTRKRLQLLDARARSTADWQRDWSEGIARARAVVDTAAEERTFVAAADGSVTLTSRRGPVPVTLENRSRYPVRLRVRVASPKLSFPAENSRLVTVSPGGVTITFVAEARSSGSFPMDVLVSSPDGRVRFPGGRVMVRSTAANVVALVLTLSGLLFLVGWSSRDVIRGAVRRRTQ